MATYIASRMMAVELIVIDVDTRSSGMPSNSSAMSSMRVDGNAHAAHFAGSQGMVRVVAHLSRQVERDAQPGHPLREQVPIPSIRLGRGPEAGVLPHRPEPAAVHRRLDAPGEGELARLAQFAGGIPGREIGRNARRINHIRQYCDSKRS